MATAALVRAALPCRHLLLVTLGLLAGLVGPGCLPARPPLQVWAADGLADVGGDSPTELESDLFSASRGEIRLTAAINETVAFQLALRSARRAAGPFDVELSDLVGPTGRLDSPSNASLYRVHAVHLERFAAWYPGHTGRPATPTTVPDVLVPWDAPRGGGPIQLADPGTALVWVDLRVPPATEPGVYRGQLAVRNTRRRTPVFQCEVRLRVLPVALPSAPSLPVICRIDPGDLLAAHLDWPRMPAEQLRLLPGVTDHQAAVQLVQATMRLFHEHLTTPVLWSSFPKYRPVGDREVAVDWAPYDHLVAGWLDGAAFDDLVGVACWPIPASLEYPSAQLEGGLSDPRYARLLSAYLAECRRHFQQRGWLDRAFLRIVPPEPLTTAAVERVQRVAGILRQSETGLPLVAHLPARSLRGLGWLNAPAIDLPDVSIWAPPATWFEPAAMQAARALGQQSWLVPTYPPYSGTISPAGLPTDTATLPWQAYHYAAGALWVEHAAEFGELTDTASFPRDGAAECLIYPGRPYGLDDRPVASLRLKRLRRGVQDHALLSLLERRGKRVLAASMASQVVRWAGTDACLDHLLDHKPTGWPRDPRLLALARELLLYELASGAGPPSESDPDQTASLAEWGLLMNQATRVHAAVEGVRLRPAGEKLRAHVSCSALNCTNRSLTARWAMPNVPVGWEFPRQPACALAPNARRLDELDLDLAGLAYNTAGAYPFDLRLDTTELGTFAAPARLAVAACPPVPGPPSVDGDLEDWALASNNVAGDFRLVSSQGRTADPGEAQRPTLPTQAFFCMDSDQLYVAVRCTLPAGERPTCRADNRVPVDGAVPWGQDVVEILIDPRPTIAGTSSDLYTLQIKPNGVLVASHGCRTDPPVGNTEAWPSEARVAVQLQDEAWIIELALPLAALGPQALDNPIWGFNITRLDARRGEYSSWSGARGQCYSPKSLGNLILLRP